MSDHRVDGAAADRVRSSVRSNYAALIREKSSGRVADQAEEGTRCCAQEAPAPSGKACCGAGSCGCAGEGGSSRAEVSDRGGQVGQSEGERLGYTPGELASVPDGATVTFGCGNPGALAGLQPGETVLDLGSGGGLDCLLAAQRVGSGGHVIGVDMTPEMIERSRANARSGGYHNVEFRLGEIEHLPVADATVDAIISNCVINLSPDKPAVFAEAFRVLRPGGRLIVSDVVSLSPIPDAQRADEALWCGCLSGAEEVSALEGMLRDAGFEGVMVTPSEPSREMVAEWTAGNPAAADVRSAVIEAWRPR